MRRRALLPPVAVVVSSPGSDEPVNYGLVDSLSRPGAIVIDATLFPSKVERKALKLLRELRPAAGLGVPAICEDRKFVVAAGLWKNLSRYSLAGMR
jgi:hypothetical protein